MTSFAERHLKKLGWVEGRGLGKNQDGITESVSLAFKNDTLGIGAAEKLRTEKTAWSDQWWDRLYNNNTQINIQIPSASSESESETTKDSQETSKKRVYDTSDENDDDNDDVTKSKFASIAEMTDEQLFEHCGRRTARKGARGLVSGSAKIERVESALIRVSATTAAPVEDFRDDETQPTKREKHKKSKKHKSKKSSKKAKRRSCSKSDD